MKNTISIEPGTFEREQHFYPRVLNAQIHPLVQYFMKLNNDQIAERYCHMHPDVDREAVHQAFSHTPRYFRWGGSDLFHATTERGERRIVVIETNSCPSGQKSMPVSLDSPEEAGYRKLLEGAFLPQLKKRGLPKGGLAVLYDKNEMEVSGYAATLAELTGEIVYLVPFYDKTPEPLARFTQGILEIKRPDGEWQPIRAALRYVTQRPWNRIPPLARTLIFNPIVICLAGGRNKMLAAKAYDLYNAELRESGLTIHVPETIWDTAKEEVPIWVQRMGGIAVVKVPYSNAGQGVYTITNEQELQAFMDTEASYDRFIVQGLVGNSGWSSQTSDGRLYHVGTVPNRRQAIYAADLRFMIGAGTNGFFPVALYSRRARAPLAQTLEGGKSSWEMLGTNLSVQLPDGNWTTEPERLLLMDQRDFNRLGVGLDDLIEGYLQSVLAVTAIDEMAKRLISKKKTFRRRLFRSLNPDQALLNEIYR
ncbi:MAG: hypothetical protein ACPGWR_13900 [Ardenticatenaceae bacterium]